MSLLQQEELDDAARGEELTKGLQPRGDRRPYAVMVVSAAIAIYMIAGQKPPFATGEITPSGCIPSTRKLQDSTPAARPCPADRRPGDGLHHRPLHNQTATRSIWATRPPTPRSTTASTPATRPTGAITTASGSPIRRFPCRIWRPFGARHHDRPRPDGGRHLRFGVHDDPAAWDARKKMDYTFEFRYQAPLTVAPHVAITER